MAGQVSTLLTLGLGSNATRSGRESIKIGAIASNLSKQEIRVREHDIIEFASIDDFIDMPMRTYSSGTKRRLAFAVSTSLDPDILLIDEALSASDARFKRKASARMRELYGHDRKIVLVSRSMISICNLADQVMWIDHGQAVILGEPNEVIAAYTSDGDETDDKLLDDD